MTYRVHIHENGELREVLPQKHDKLTEAVDVARRSYLSNTALYVTVEDSNGVLMAEYPRKNK